MAVLTGSSEPVEVARGYALIAPGVAGTANADDAAARPSVTRGAAQALSPWEQAWQGVGMTPIKTIKLNISDVSLRSALPLRTADGADALLLEVSDLAPESTQVVMVRDADGAITWSFAAEPDATARPSVTRGGAPTKRFLIRRTAPPPDGGEAKRSVIRPIGQLVLTVIDCPWMDKLLGSAAERVVSVLEPRLRPYGVRWFTPDNYGRRDVPTLETDDWKGLARGRSLLFVHGFFSTAHGAFCGLPQATLEELERRYEGRVVAFNHPTICADPEQNARWFLQERLKHSGELPLDLDIICHSRGGLVSRVLAGELGRCPRDSNLEVRRIIFAGTPNHGTALADREHLVHFIDRVTTLLDLVPLGPPNIVSEALQFVLWLVKLVAHLGSAVVDDLPGAWCMHPSEAFLRELNAPCTTTARYYAFTANYEPQGGLANLVRRVMDHQVVDCIFQAAANDVIVPTDGVFQGDPDPAFPIPEDRLVRFAPERSVSHFSYFLQPETSQRILEWLADDASHRAEHVV